MSEISTFSLEWSAFVSAKLRLNVIKKSPTKDKKKIFHIAATAIATLLTKRICHPFMTIYPSTLTISSYLTSTKSVAIWLTSDFHCATECHRLAFPEI